MHAILESLCALLCVMALVIRPVRRMIYRRRLGETFSRCHSLMVKAIKIDEQISDLVIARQVSAVPDNGLN